VRRVAPKAIKANERERAQAKCSGYNIIIIIIIIIVVVVRHNIIIMTIRFQ
jgi:hypothetical protein